MSYESYGDREVREAQEEVDRLKQLLKIAKAELVLAKAKRDAND